MRLIVSLCACLGVACLIISVIFRLIGEGYVIPYIRVSASSMLNFTNAVFLMAISLGMIVLLNNTADKKF
jgi:hypothetical protein